MKPTNIYVIGNDSGIVKVGLASSPKRRLMELQTGHSEPLKLHFISELPQELSAPVERRAHWLLKDKHRSGEWFTVGPSTAIEAVKSAIECRGEGEKANFSVGRPPLSRKSMTKAVLVRLTEDLVSRIDAIAGENRRGQFIREAAIKELERREREAR